ncbi:retrovirus-related pol polyprotein LINE-1 [Tanacetum coccineum]
MRGDEANRIAAEERYKAAKKEAKLAVAKAKEKAYENLYKRLDSKEGENDIYKISKARERRKMDLGSVRFIKDEDGRSIISEDAIRRRWKEYFFALFSGQRHIKVKEVLRKMGRNKVVGLDEIPIEAWRCLGSEGVRWLTLLFNKTFLRAKMPEEWRLSEKRVIGRRLRRETEISENQFGFMSGRYLMEAIHIIRSLMEKYRERKKDLHLAFLDLKKAYDSVPRELIWKTLRDKGTLVKYIKVIQDIYEGACTCVRTLTGNSEFLPVDVGLHQGSTISQYLFALILDKLSRGIQESIPWCLIFADDIVLVSKTPEGLNERLEQWRETLENKGPRVSMEKTKYMRCDFNNNENDQNEEAEIRIGEDILRPNESFKYLGYVIHKSDKIKDDLKEKFYRVVIRPAMLYGSKCWSLTKVQANRVDVAEIRMLSRRPQSAPVRRVESITIDGVRRMGRPKLRWEDRLKTDLMELLLSEDMTSDRNSWRTRIGVDEVGA